MRYDESIHSQLAQAGQENEGPRRLWAMVFALGLQDFVSEHARVTDRGAKPDEASRWFWNAVEAPGSFVWCCNMFDRDPGRTRALVLQQYRELAAHSRQRQVPREAGRLYS